MRVSIAGAHGQVARLLIPQLRAGGHTVRSRCRGARLGGVRAL